MPPPPPPEPHCMEAVTKHVETKDAIGTIGNNSRRSQMTPEFQPWEEVQVPDIEGILASDEKCAVQI